MTTEQTETAPETKATKKAAAGARRANVAPAKAKAGKKGQPEKEGAPERAKRRPRGQQNCHDPGAAEAAGRRNCQGTAQGDRLAAAFSAGLHQRHAGKKMGLAVTSTKGEDGERIYSVKA